MPIRFTCKCGQRLVMLDEHAGRRVRCRQCGLEQTVPSVDPTAPDIQPIDFSAQSTRGKKVSEGVPAPRFLSESADEEEVPEFHMDPWYYYLFRFLGLLMIVAGGVGMMIGLLTQAGKEAGVAVALVTIAYSFGTIIAGAGILLLVDVARNIRRLRLHADRNLLLFVDIVRNIRHLRQHADRNGELE